jgi:hypothetical protein
MCSPPGGSMTGAAVRGPAVKRCPGCAVARPFPPYRPPQPYPDIGSIITLMRIGSGPSARWSRDSSRRRNRSACSISCVNRSRLEPGAAVLDAVRVGGGAKRLDETKMCWPTFDTELKIKGSGAEYASRALSRDPILAKRSAGMRALLNDDRWNSQMGPARRHSLVLDSTSNRPVLKRMSDDFELAL